MDLNIIDICKKKITGEDIRSWDEIATPLGYKSGEALRQAYKKYRAKDGTLPSTKSNLDLEAIELKKERIKLRDERNELNRLIRESARKETTQEIIFDAVSQLNELRPLNISKKNITESDNEALLFLSDWHFGEQVDLKFNKYNEEVFVDRLESLTFETIKRAKLNGCKVITIMGLGDLLSGGIHTSTRVQNKEDIIMQTKIVSEYLAKFLYELALEFDKVNFYSVSGNHGRVFGNKEDSTRNENFENLIPWYLKARTSNVSNVEIYDNNYDKDIIVTEIKGKIIFGVHGENTKMTTISNDLGGMLRYMPDIVAMGHLHFPEYRMDNQTHVFRNGSLIGNNNYSNSIYKSSDANQTLLIISEKDVEAIYNINLA